MKRLAMLRLERIYLNKNGYYCNSSFVKWLSNIETKIDKLIIISPVLKGDDNWKGYTWQPLDSTNIYELPDNKGYLKAIALSPIVCIQVFRARLRSNKMLMRMPEHGNMLNAIICKILFLDNLYIWLVADRNKLLDSEIKNRKYDIKLACGILVNNITGVIEKIIGRSSYGVVNGKHLVTNTGMNFKRYLPIESTTFAANELIYKARPRINEKASYTILYVGRLSPEKSLDLLIHAALNLSEILKVKIEVRLCGDSHMHYGNHLRNIAKVTDDVNFTFLGHVPFGDSLFIEYTNADVLCLPSATEGTARVLMEACAFGLPFVVSDIPAIKSIVTDSEIQNPGITFIPNRIDSLANALKNIYKDGALYESCSEACIKKASSQTIEIQQNQIIEFIYGIKSL